MSEKTDDDGWEKAREMIRNAPPPTAQVPFEPDQPHPEPPKRSPVGRILLVLGIMGLIGAGIYVWSEYASQLSGVSTTTADAPKAAVVAPQPKVESAPAPVVRVTVRKGVKSVNVRSGPTPDSAQVGRVAGGQQVEKLSESGDWSRVRFSTDKKQIEGWMRSDLLQN